jgi:hypothetical protein
VIRVHGGIVPTFRLASWLALRAEVTAVVPLARPAFEIEGVETIHRPASMALRVGLGLDVRFGVGGASSPR